ncbi:MAG: CotS family spore coat protein, partial [Clostridiaceae bacterium]|nr:CotS family spore coat protein [Clostridiaceae bacterium]
HTFDKALFSVHAQDYAKKSGGRVPEVLRDKSDNLIVNYNEQLFVLYEWLIGRDLEFGNKEDLRRAVAGLADFHAATKGYKAPNNARVSTKLGKWPDQYSSMKNKLINWKETARENSSIQCYDVYLKYVEDMVELSESALRLLKKSSYCDLTSDASSSVVLCHQDYGKGNALLVNNDVYVIDLDGVTFDHPVRDLRKIIGKLAENKGIWDLTSISDILGWYREFNPLDKKEEELLYIDLLYPHWFYGLVKNMFLNGKTISSSKLEKISNLEKSKTNLFSSIF